MIESFLYNAKILYKFHSFPFNELQVFSDLYYFMSPGTFGSKIFLRFITYFP